MITFTATKQRRNRTEYKI